MGSNTSALLPDEEVQPICDETGFTSKQVQRLYIRFQELEKRKRNPPLGFLTREDLLDIHKVASNPLGERLVDVIVEDYGDANRLNFRQYANVLARFRRGKGTTELATKRNKLLFLFSIYDRNHDSRIDRKELVEILKLMVGGYINEDQISMIADHTIGELDANGDLTITFDEFCNTLARIDVDEKMSMKFSS